MNFRKIVLFVFCALYNIISTPYMLVTDTYFTIMAIVKKVPLTEVWSMINEHNRELHKIQIEMIVNA